jgi:hypothetical protein
MPAASSTAHDRGQSVTTRRRSIGAALVIERLRQATGIGQSVGQRGHPGERRASSSRWSWAH